MNITIALLIFIAVYMLTNFIVTNLLPGWIVQYKEFQNKRAKRISENMEDSFVFWEKKKLFLLYLAPFVFAGLGFLLTFHFIGAIVGFIVGLAFPNVMVKLNRARRLRQFQSQLVDGLMIISSSLKGGLSLIQAIEVLCEEMPAPMSQEFNMVLKENRWGMSLEESFLLLKKRVPLDDVNLLVTSLLIARETGGDLTRVLAKLTNTIRDNIKVKEKVATLTLQGRLQGIVMSFLPIGFGYFIFKQNPEHFNIMWQSDMGRTMLLTAIGLQLLGMYLIKRISTLRG